MAAPVQIAQEVVQWIRRHWRKVYTSYWFVPATMVAGSVVLATAAVEVDDRFGGRFDLTWIALGPDSARAFLTTVAGSMATIAGVTFSITMVALTLASGQFGPRLVTNYVRDRGNQVVLGTFLSTFVYCLLVLRIYSPTEGADLPQASLATAFLLALVSLSMFIYFVHHSALTIQAPHLVGDVAGQLDKALDRLLEVAAEDRPSRRGVEDEDRVERVRRDGEAVQAVDSGYLDRIQGGFLADVAREHDLLVVCVKKPGQFVVAGTTILRVSAGDAAAEDPPQLDEEVIDQLRDGWPLISRRSPGTVEFLIYELVEVAVRSLSPGINDPFTAIHCIDLLGAALCRFAEQPPQRPVRRDDAGVLRVALPEVVLPDLLDAAFHQIRQYGRGRAGILIRLLERLADLAERAESGRDREAVLRHAAMVRRNGMESVEEGLDREDVEARYRWVLEAAEAGRWEPPEEGEEGGEEEGNGA